MKIHDNRITNLTICDYVDRIIEYEYFGYNILFEEKEKIDIVHKDKDKSKITLYNEGKLSKLHTYEYSDDSIICRYILYYYIESKDTVSFKIEDLVGWLLDYCPIFINMYQGAKSKTNISNRINQNKSIVLLLLQRLNFLELIEYKSVNAYSNEETTDYKFTELGKLVALILKFSERPNNYLLVDRIFNQALTYYKSQNYAHAKFCVLFFTNCYNKDKRLFEAIIISKLLEILKEPPNDKNSIINKLRNFRVFYNSVSMFIVLINSVNEFKIKNPSDYDKFAYRLKLSIESFQEKKSNNLRAFEELRYIYNHLLNSVVLSGYCFSCNHTTPALTSMYGYLQALVECPHKESRSPCPKCNSQIGLTFE